MKHSFSISVHILWIITFFEEGAPAMMLLFHLAAAAGQLQNETAEVCF